MINFNWNWNWYLSMLYKVYVLYAISYDKLYVGLTNSLTDRLALHNSDSSEEWTTEYQPWTLIHMEIFNNEYEALLRETYLKSAPGQKYIREDILSLFTFN